MTKEHTSSRNVLSKVMPETNDDLFYKCVALGADRAAVAAWPNFKRKQFIADKLYEQYLLWCG